MKRIYCITKGSTVYMRPNIEVLINGERRACWRRTGWQQYETQKTVWYTDEDRVIDHPIAQEYVFNLPRAAFPWVQLCIRTMNVQTENR